MALFVLGLCLFMQLPYAWWWFPVLLLSPDIGMLGYLFGKRIGAMVYNIFHHRGLAVVLYGIGVITDLPIYQLMGAIVFSHCAMDRFFGYGLKYEKGFKYTHLGEIGKANG